MEPPNFKTASGDQILLYGEDALGNLKQAFVHTTGQPLLQCFMNFDQAIDTMTNRIIPRHHVDVSGILDGLLVAAMSSIESLDRADDQSLVPQGARCLNKCWVS